jgi:hypothetical protein
MHRLSVSLVAIPLLLLPVACGDDGPSKEDFIADGDRICLDLRRDVDAIEVPPADAGPDEAQEYIDQVRPVVEQAKDDFAGVEASSEDDGEQLKDDVVATLDDQIAKLDDVDAAIQANDPVAVTNALQQLEERGDDVDAALQRYGFEECGRQD